MAYSTRSTRLRSVAFYTEHLGFKVGISTFQRSPPCRSETLNLLSGRGIRFVNA
jgi:hypothetical protein